MPEGKSVARAKTRITDLEEFALRHVWRPYQNKVGFEERRLERIPMSLDETVKKLVLDETGWAELVLSRIAAVGFTFPAYIVHPLVDLVRAEQARRRAPPHHPPQRRAEP